MKAKAVRLPHGGVWLRVAAPDWDDPLDPSYAQVHGGRWNPPKSYPTLYMSGDVGTARMQIERMLEGSPVSVDDLDDLAYVLVAATLPRGQICADAVTVGGLRALGLPDTYPQNDRGEEIEHEVCQPIGQQVHRTGLRGLWCRSACTVDGRGRELAWFPATNRSVARPVWNDALPLGAWRYAARWGDLGLDRQPDPTV